MHFSRLSPLQRYLSFHKSSRRRTSTARPPSRLTLSLLTLLQPVRALLPRVPTFQGGNGNSHPSALPFGSHPRSNVCVHPSIIYSYFFQSPLSNLSFLFSQCQILSIWIWLLELDFSFLFEERETESRSHFVEEWERKFVFVYLLSPSSSVGVGRMRDEGSPNPNPTGLISPNTEEHFGPKLHSLLSSNRRETSRFSLNDGQFSSLQSNPPQSQSQCRKRAQI